MIDILDKSFEMTGKNTTYMSSILNRFYSYRDGLYLDLGHELKKDIQLLFPYDLNSDDKKYQHGFTVNFDTNQFSGFNSNLIIPIFGVRKSLDGVKVDYYDKVTSENSLLSLALSMVYSFSDRFMDYCWMDCNTDFKIYVRPKNKIIKISGLIDKKESLEKILERVA